MMEAATDSTRVVTQIRWLLSAVHYRAHPQRRNRIPPRVGTRLADSLVRRGPLRTRRRPEMVDRPGQSGSDRNRTRTLVPCIRHRLAGVRSHRHRTLLHRAMARSRPQCLGTKVGLVACAGVIPLALICGPIRGIPFYWRLIDCSFGIFGAIPLLICLKLISRLRDPAQEQTGRVNW
jgi:hypothetical protein